VHTDWPFAFESDTMLMKMKYASYPFKYVMGYSNANISINSRE